MGYLLKEALKALCGVNQWSYAVFWKIGHQNLNYLVWEKCYYESTSKFPLIPGNPNGEIAYQDFNASWVSAETCSLQSNEQTAVNVHLLLTEMMTDSHVIVVGEGLVGRVAFSGNYQWILSENYYREAYPQEVVRELWRQFSAGMKTVAVIPILPHGVVQFGSYSSIMESPSFVSYVMSLVLQFIHLPGISLFEDCTSKELGDSALGEVQNVVQSTVATFHASSSIPSNLKSDIYNHESKHTSSDELDFYSPIELMDGVVKAELIPSQTDIWRNQHTSLCIPRSPLDLPPSSSSSLNEGRTGCTVPKILFDNCNQGCFGRFGVPSEIMWPLLRPNSDEASVLPSEVNELCKSGLQKLKTLSGVAVSGGNNENIVSNCLSSSGPRNVNFPKMEASFSDSVDNLTTNSFLGCNSGSKYHLLDEKFTENEFLNCKEESKLVTKQAHHISQSLHNEHLRITAVIPSIVEDGRKEGNQCPNPTMINTRYNDSSIQPQWGDDLFDMLGVDFKNKLFSRDTDAISTKKSLASFEICESSLGKSDSVVLLTDNDHLLNAVVLKAHPTAKQSLDDSILSRTTISNMSSSSVTNVSPPHGLLGASDQMIGELHGLPKYLGKAGSTSSCSLRTVSSKQGWGTSSRNSSIYGSQISSWIDKGHKTKQMKGVIDGCSKQQPDEISKTNRKKLKSGENPRPRPKDRQMIQDCVKELRELVPNGAKCSIDSLLERTIKHMLFLQNITKHADKLRQMGESKLIGKDGNLLLKHNLRGGATWAYEISSQSRVCPIIVEDLNNPHQMIVEMLCEERGLFLEIADIIRGLGLTILKGNMETWNDKIWAQFAVEANRDVTRMEIFISLGSLLDQSRKSGFTQTDISNANTFPEQQLHQAPSLPVTTFVCDSNAL